MVPADEPPLLAVVGPTAAGKSELALALARELGGEIVNADALQVYRGFDVGTAKPSPEERARVRHHLVDILDPRERYSAGQFALLARAAIAEIRSRGATPIVVGGSGLYLRALFEGLSPIPPGDPIVRESLRERLKEEGLESLKAELAHLDPITAGRLLGADTQRVLRALEVAKVSGRPLSAWIEEQPFGSQQLAGIRIGLTLPRGILYDQIARRIDRMLAAGWIEEVIGLLRGGLAPDLPAFQAIGYRELVHFVEVRDSLAAAVGRIVQSTRRFAKRQETWFRREKDIHWITARDLNDRAEQVLEYVKHRGTGRAYGR